MNQAVRKYFEPLITMNCRLSIGSGLLALIMISEGALIFIRPLA